MWHKIRNTIAATALFFIAFTPISLAEEPAHNHEPKAKGLNVGEMIMHHISDAHEWEFAHGVAIPLPVIIYTADRGLEVFSSSHFYHNPVAGHEHVYKHEDYILEHEHIYRATASGEVDKSVQVWDFSITKNVASMLLSAVLLVLIFGAVAKGYATNRGKAPKGIQAVIEPIILFIRDEVIKPSIGVGYERFAPYLLTLFFFIFINNLLGLIPGGANLTGNIAVTLVLALLTFIIVHISANKHYYMHLLKPTGVPIALLPIMVPVEIVGVFMKPFSLMIRLFANITAGHIIILSLLGLIFIARDLGGAGTGLAVSPLVLVFTLFMNLIELLVAFLQAFIFTLLTSMYIGSAVENNHEADHGH
ncbi:MAG: ATP synthase F0 subunit A [Cytophagia bacterium]|nr:MAG: ATP synthase F0 subunit A [Runella sp.]TAG23740.1 MAG: ATP synthase F0 subunit A [Cytophagales bacterium]TAG43000.1 MAG: ATP synthase F0 subunit A [Cytophagia bacterium]TAG76482.1 MAG: ATP synthase F0 subunit A [Cytophagales bacterium]